MTNPPARTVAIIAAGGMGAPLGARLTHAGYTVLTPLAGRSPASARRAAAAGMRAAELPEIARRAGWVLSVLPPAAARGLAERVRAAWDGAAAERERARKAEDGEGEGEGEEGRRMVYVDCNAVSPTTARGIARVFADAPGVVFLDVAIIGLPPSVPGADGARYDPTIYAAADPADAGVLDEFDALGGGAIKVVPLRGAGVGIGDASALKMSYAGLTKGLMGLFTTMILSAHASSPATAAALLTELGASQPQFLARIAGSIPPMLPKAYRFAGEMEEIAEFVGGKEGETFRGMAALYERVARSMGEDEADGDGEGDGSESDARVLREFARSAQEAIARRKDTGVIFCEQVYHAHDA